MKNIRIDDEIRICPSAIEGNSYPNNYFTVGKKYKVRHIGSSYYPILAEVIDDRRRIADVDISNTDAFCEDCFDKSVITGHIKVPKPVNSSEVYNSPMCRFNFVKAYEEQVEREHQELEGERVIFQTRRMRELKKIQKATSLALFAACNVGLYLFYDAIGLHKSDALRATVITGPVSFFFLNAIKNEIIGGRNRYDVESHLRKKDSEKYMRTFGRR
jgi:hypothetical protein